MPLEPAPPQRPTLWEAWKPWQLALYALLLLGANVFWQSAVFGLTGSVFLSVLVAGLVAIILPCAGAAWWHGRTLASTFELRFTLPAALGGAAAGLLAWLPASMLAGLSARMRPPTQEYLDFLREQLPTAPWEIAAAFVAAAVVAPVAEELVFRGLLYRTARERWGPGGAAVLTALFFGIAHWEPWSLFGLVALGLLLCWLYERSGSLLAPIAAHGTHNTVSLALMLQWRDQLGHEQAAGPLPWLGAAACVVVLAGAVRPLIGRGR